MYKHLIVGDLRIVETFSNYKRNHVIKSLIALSKFLGIYRDFKQRLMDHGIKLSVQDSFASFLRILTVNVDEILDWYRSACEVLKEHERLYFKFMLLTGLRRTEGIIAFNRIIELHKANKLEDYYDYTLNCLMHFKYPKDFIRRTKNCYISFIPESLVNKIANSKPVSQSTIRKRLRKNNLRCEINKLRDFYGTYLLKHGILEQEINLLQGRIPKSIFIKHYWSPNLKDLRTRIFEALKQLEQQLN